MDLSGQRLHAGQSFFGNHLIFDGNRAGGGHPYSNFTVRAIDLDNAESKDCTFLLTFSCPPGLYNNIFSNGTGELCEQCPQGAVCSTDGKIGPRPQQGWWRSEDNSTFLECFPAKACPGTSANVCGTGYRGVRCAECQQNYYRFGEACIECSAINFIPSIIVLITLTGIMLFVSYIRRMKIYQSRYQPTDFVFIDLILKRCFRPHLFSFALMNIVINFLQTIWMLRKVRLNWPPELIAIIDYINFLNFNVELISPECLLKMSLNFSQKSRIVLALPIILLLLVTFIFALLMFINVFKSPRGSSRTFSPSNLLTSAEKYGGNNNGALLRIIKAFNIALSVLYVNLAAKSLSLFDCTYESDGKAYLDDEVALVCYQEWWYRDLPINIASVTLYVVGIPLYFGVLSYLCFQTRHPESSWEKCRQIAQVIIHCDGHFKTKCQYFVVVQLLHKLAILCISLFFSRYTGLQLVLTIISLQSILLAYIKFNPYLDQTLNTLEKMSVICSMLVLALGLPFRVDSFQLAQYRVGLVTIILSVIFGFILVVIGAALRDIFQARSKRLTERKRLTQFSTSRVAIINST
ncbi:hypothetical protein BKA69DRAFT_1104795 [Paraphysoderma sedebokerense]|nr:hypothetical protein BKA69DRAFT_1104795 [Paraphysoderma sedebokerense]